MLCKGKSMSPEEYYQKIVALYRSARFPKFRDETIIRGRSHTISGALEDLTALFISKNIPGKFIIFIDQPMPFGTHGSKYPDLAIKNLKNNTITSLVDVKTDLGWGRDKMLEFCQYWNSAIEDIKGSSVKFKSGIPKNYYECDISKNVKYHIIISSLKNSGNTLENDVNKINKMKNVKLYIFSDGKHPNDYSNTKTKNLDGINIRKSEINSFLSAIKKA